MKFKVVKRKIGDDNAGLQKSKETADKVPYCTKTEKVKLFKKSNYTVTMADKKF